MEVFDIEEAIIIGKHIQKQKNIDRRKYIYETIGKYLDVRDRYLGIRQLKRPFRPIPYTQHDQQRQTNQNEKNRAEAAAQHLAEICEPQEITHDTKGENNRRRTKRKHR